MTETPQSGPKPRTPEQLAAVKKRALPVALAAVLFGIAGVLLLLATHVAVRRPPNILAANLSFCAIMIGIGILYYARGAPGTRVAKVLCLIGIILGMAGPVIFASQSVSWHNKMEDQEASNAAAIAQAAQKFAREHEGTYPKDFMEMVSGSYLDAERLLSPFGGDGSDYIGSLKTPLIEANRPAVIAEHADYTYAGADLHLPLNESAAAKIIVVYETDPVMRDHFAVGFADGTARFLELQDAQAAMEDCNKARGTVGLKPLEQPDSVKRALQVENQK